MQDYKNLIQDLKTGGYLKTPKIIKAFWKIKRRDFLPENLKYDAAVNTPLPIGQDQTNSQPLTVAFMLELLEPKKGQKIMDVGSGSAWTTALLAEIVGPKGKVFGLERIKSIKEFGEANVKKYNFVEEGRVKLLNKDGFLGLETEAPFDRILGSASLPRIPETWKKQLKTRGIIVAPVGNALVKLTKTGQNKFKEEKFPGFVFVPMVGALR